MNNHEKHKARAEAIARGEKECGLDFNPRRHGARPGSAWWKWYEAAWNEEVSV